MRERNEYKMRQHTRGDTLEFYVTVWQETDFQQSLYTVSGTGFTYTVKTSNEDPTPYYQATVGSGISYYGANEIKISVPASTTTNWDLRDYPTDIQMTISGTDIFTIRKEILRVTPDITR